MRINNIQANMLFLKASSKKHKALNQSFKTNPVSLSNFYYNDFIMFTSRVDKGLERFYKTNENRMPKTLKDYINSLNSKENIEPIDALFNAFEGLTIADDVNEVKEFYEDEPLFQNLIPWDKSMARGIIRQAKQNGEDILDSGEDISIYLLKKIFLEAKSLNEINEDLDNDINPIFQNEDKNYISYSILNSLGIQLPNREYLTSLRFTKPGYSDEMGLKIIQAWENLPEEKKLERSKKSIQNIENWWYGLSIEQQLEIASKPDAELEFLKHKKGERNSNKSITLRKHAKKNKDQKIQTPLKNEQLFIDFATKQLQIFQESLTDEQKAELLEQKSKFMIEKWANLKPEDKVELINKLQTGNEAQRFAMINTWNNCDTVREHLSDYLSKHNIHSIERVIYKETDYSEYQRIIMTEFWKQYPDDADKLGTEISKSYELIKKSKAEDTFDDLKKEILKKQAIEKQKIKSRKTLKDNIKPQKLDIFEELEKTFKEANPYYPDKYIKDFISLIKANGADENQIKLMIKSMKAKGTLTDSSYKKLNEIIRGFSASQKFIRNANALDIAMKEIIYEATNKEMPEIFYMKNINNVFDVLSQVSKYPYTFITGDKKHSITIYNKPDFDKLEKLYNKYSEPPSREAKRYVYKMYKKNMNQTPFYQYINNFDDKCRELIYQYADIVGASLDEVYNNPDSKMSECILNIFGDGFIGFVKEKTQ